MSKLTFSTTPDVCLLLVFDKIPLNDLLRHVNLVNRHWNTISRVACQHRKRLVVSLSWLTHEREAFDVIIESVYSDPLEVCQPRNRYFGGEHDALIVPDADERLNGKSIERLIERLPNISTLEVNLFYLDFSASEHLATLITGWREHLVTLKLFTFYDGDRSKCLYDGLGQLTNLHTTINSLPVLHHLTYQLDFAFNCEYHNENESLTFPISCPSLKELYFTSSDFVYGGHNSETTVWLFLNAFSNYVQSEEAVGLRRIACYIPNLYELKDYLAASDVLASKYTHIALDFKDSIYGPKLMAFCRKFNNLTHIKYDIHYDFTIDKLSKCFSTLEHLKHITFSYSDSVQYEQFEKRWLENNNSDPYRIIPQADRIKPLIHVKSVHLELNHIRWHQYLAEDMCFNLIFPNVELITIQNYAYACVHCGGYIDTQMRKTTRKREWHNCIGPFLAPIAKCDKLKRIEYKDESDFAICCSFEGFKLAWADFID